MGAATIEGLKAGADWYSNSIHSANTYLEPAQREALHSQFKDMLSDLGMSQHIAFAETRNALPQGIGNLVVANEVETQATPAAASFKGGTEIS
jgi:hypothetical protein